MLDASEKPLIMTTYNIHYFPFSVIFNSVDQVFASLALFLLLTQKIQKIFVHKIDYKCCSKFHVFVHFDSKIVKMDNFAYNYWVWNI